MTAMYAFSDKCIVGGMTILEFRNGPTVKVPIIGGKELGGTVQWQMSFNKTDGISKTKLLRAYSLRK